MARSTKDHRSFSIKISTPVFERLNKHCEETCSTKTGVVERALIEYLDKYDREREFLEKHMK